ncbi:MAG: hypothetical protein Q9187_001293 [Circinaria calcarea]
MDCRGDSSFAHALKQQGCQYTASNIQTIDTRTMDSPQDITYPHQEIAPSHSRYMRRCQPYYSTQSYSAQHPYNYHQDGSYYRPNSAASASPYSYHEGFLTANHHNFGGDAPHQEVKAEPSEQHNQWSPGEFRESSSNSFAGASTGYSNTDDVYSPQPAFVDPSAPAPHGTQASSEQQKHPEEPTHLLPFHLTSPATSELPNPYRPDLSPSFPPHQPDPRTANAITTAYQEITHLKAVISAQKIALSDARMIALQEAKHYASEHERICRLAESVREGTANSKTVMYAMDEMAPRLLQRKQTMETLAKRVDCGDRREGVGGEGAVKA